MSGVISSNLALKWNSEKLDSFSPTRGLRQWDLLSPYLFLLCTDKLALLIQSKVENQQRFSIKIYENGLTIFHLFFADDFFSPVQSLPRCALLERFFILSI